MQPEDHASGVQASYGYAGAVKMWGAIAVVLAGCQPAAVRMSYVHRVFEQHSGPTMYDPRPTKRLVFELAITAREATLVERVDSFEDGGWFVAEPTHTYRGTARLRDDNLHLDLHEDGGEWTLETSCHRQREAVGDGEAVVWECGELHFWTSARALRIVKTNVRFSTRRLDHVARFNCPEEQCFDVGEEVRPR